MDTKRAARAKRLTKRALQELHRYVNPPIISTTEPWKIALAKSHRATETRRASMHEKGKKTITYWCVIEPDGDGYLAWFPRVPGALSDGKTRSEAKANAREALALWCVTALDQGSQPLPNDRPPTKRDLRNKGARAVRIRARLGEKMSAGA
ncbi:MAG: type II toxin-antitoxin system HicB family antitoxin [bacterium]|nr:type II toxin-antitoxin system HicB family antitoxin [bacterium]